MEDEWRISHADECTQAVRELQEELKGLGELHKVLRHDYEGAQSELCESERLFSQDSAMLFKERKTLLELEQHNFTLEKFIVDLDLERSLAVAEISGLTKDVYHFKQVKNNEEKQLNEKIRRFRERIKAESDFLSNQKSFLEDNSLISDVKFIRTKRMNAEEQLRAIETTLNSGTLRKGNLLGECQSLTSDVKSLENRVEQLQQQERMVEEKLRLNEQINSLKKEREVVMEQKESISKKRETVQLEFNNLDNEISMTH